MGNSQCCHACAGGEPLNKEKGDGWVNDDEIDPHSGSLEEPVLVSSCCGAQQKAQDTEVPGSGRSSWRSGDSAGSGRCGRPSGGSVQDFESEAGKDGVLSPSSIGTVIKARHRHTSAVHALRQIAKKRLAGGGWKDEMITLRQLDHPHICKLHETWEDALSVYLVMEYCKGGNLTDLSANREHFSESSIAMLVEQMVDAVDHLHEHRLVHSDLRPENWLFGEPVGPTSSALDMNLKMIDFGLASKHGKKGRRSWVEGLWARPATSSKSSSSLSPAGGDGGGGKEALANSTGGMRKLFCQSPEQAGGGMKDVSAASSDEAISDTFGEKADCWAMGVIAYFMLSGQSPFPLTATSPESDLSFHNARFVFMPTSIWRPVSAEAKHFIALCLQKDPALRPGAKQLLALPWMQLAKAARNGEARAGADNSGDSRVKFTPLDAALPTAGTILSVFDHMRRLQLIQRAAIIAAAFRVPPDGMHSIWKAFEHKDDRKSGSLMLKDLLQVLQQADVPCQDLTQLAEDGGNGTCEIVYADFMDDLREFQQNTQDNAMWEVFTRFDGDHEGRRKKAMLVKALSDTGYGQNVAAKFPQLSMERVLANLQNETQPTLGFEDFRNVFMNQANRARRDSRFAK